MRNSSQVMNLRSELRERRLELGLSLETIAERTGVLPEDVAEFERYDSNPTLRYLLKYASAVETEIFMGING